MSWLDELNRKYRAGHYAYQTRCVYLDESPDCCVNFSTMHQDAVVLNFECMIDDCAELQSRAHPPKCDLMVLQGTESRIDIVLVEVKAGTSTYPPPDPAKALGKAMTQLRRSVYIVRTELANSETSLPDRVNRHAVVVMRAPEQGQIRLDLVSMSIAEFRRQTGFRLQIALCGEDIGQLIGAGLE